MFEKARLKSQISKCKERIESLEQKRARSQAAITQALLKHEEPNDADVDYFNIYTAQIDEARTVLHNLMTELDAK